MWPQNVTNICMNEYICLEIFEYSNIIEILHYKTSKYSINEYLNAFVALKYNQYFHKWTYMSRNIWIFAYICIFVTHWYMTVFRCLSPFKIGTYISLEKSVWADFLWNTFKKKNRFNYFMTKSLSKKILRQNLDFCESYVHFLPWNRFFWT